MDFQKLLLEAGNALCKDEVKALAFLCTDLLGRNLASVESASDLFAPLANQDHLSAERPHLLTELLLAIHRPRLVRDLRLSEQVSTTSSLISPYRKLLYNLSEELTDNDLKNVKFLLKDKLPRRKLEDHVTTLEVFQEMEHMDYISDTHLDLLENIIQLVCPVLRETISQFKAQQAPLTGTVTQETSRPRAKTYHFEPSQVPQSPERTFSCEAPEFQPLAKSTVNSSNTSMDFQNMLHGGDECEALSCGLRSLSTETSSCASLTVRTDALVISQKNETSAGNQMSQTTSTNTLLGTYPMTAAKTGFCLIINNYDFTKSGKGLQKREGTNVDKECLHKVFEWLGFEVETQTDCESSEMLSLMRELSSRNHSQTGCLVCCILSHGQEGSVYGVDGRTVAIEDLMAPFNGFNCSSLAEKPKLFFIQACQGTGEQKAVYIQADGPERSPIHSDAIEVKKSIPSDADFLLGMATVPSFISFRDRKNGTWFIQSLCQNLVQMVPSGWDLVSILTKVNADVSQRTDPTGVKKQMPQPAFSLRKKVVFPIPRAPPPTL
ncbi:caspase-8 [Chelmon rostratus]|uniref:caspase-8 n=1 Tax=Chelmon rostratus TaxID=109905 RepID=UPI001BED2F4F|nr:caspase-8 [Chelmon rostratus]